jgi:hypothetical protein
MGRVLVLIDHEEFPKDVLKLVQNGLKDGREHMYLGVIIHELFAYDASGSSLKNVPIEFEPLLSEEEQYFGDLTEAFKNTLTGDGLKAKRCYGECLNPIGVVDESAYADLMVMSSRYFEAFFKDAKRRCEFRQMLKNLQCPLLVIPTAFEDFNEVFLVHEDRNKLVSTIKSCESALSRNLKNAEVSLITHMPNNEEEFEREKRLMEFLQQHYRNVGLLVVYNQALEFEVQKQVDLSSHPLVVISHFSDWVFEELMLPILQSESGKRCSFFIGNPGQQVY